MRQIHPVRGRGQEVRQHPRAVQALPPQQLIGHLVVLVPTHFVGDEILHPRQLDQLGQRPAIAEGIRQPQDRRIHVAEMTAEVAAPQQELPRQQFRADGVAIRLDPRAAHRLPAPLFHPLLDLLEQLRVVFFGVFVELRLTLGKRVLRELVHQPQHRAEGAPGLANRLRERPQPRHVDVRVPHTDDVHVHRLARLANPLFQRFQRRRDAGIKRVGAQRVVGIVFPFLGRLLLDAPRIYGHERGIERVVQPRLDRIVIVKLVGSVQRHPRGGDEIPRRLVDQHDRASAHVQFDVRVARDVAAGPAVQRQLMDFAVAPLRR